jgi:1-acyl-sn-glycerol-3-phosphate acyltransferase
MMRATRQIPVKGKGVENYVLAVDKARAGLAAGDWVHFFVENTRCTRGFYGTQKFSLGAFQLAMQMGVPIVPIVFIHTDKSWPKGVNGICFREKNRVLTLPEINPAEFSSPITLMQETKRRIDVCLREHHDS